MAEKKETPKPARKDSPYVGFDEEATRRAQETAERSRKSAAGPRGESADDTYVDAGPDEAARRMGATREDVERDVEDAARRSKRQSD